MLGELLRQRALDHPACDLAQHTIAAQDLALGALADDQLVDHPIEQPLAQLVGQLVALGSELLQQRVDQLPSRRIRHTRQRPSQPRLTERLLDHLRRGLTDTGGGEREGIARRTADATLTALKLRSIELVSVQHGRRLRLRPAWGLGSRRRHVAPVRSRLTQIL